MRQRATQPWPYWAWAAVWITGGLGLWIVGVAVFCAQREMQDRIVLAEESQKIRLSLGSDATVVHSMAWMESHASKAHTEEWGRVFNALNGPFIENQLANLQMRPSDDPNDLRWVQENSHGPTPIRQVWQVHPELLHDFLETIHPLIEEIHRLCRDPEVVFIPVNDEADAFPDPRNPYRAAQVMVLVCEDAILRSDRVALDRGLRTLRALDGNFSYPSEQMAVQSAVVRTLFAGELHRGLDANLIDPEEWSVWLDRLKSDSDLVDLVRRCEIFNRSRTLSGNVTSIPIWKPTSVKLLLLKESASAPPSAMNPQLLQMQDYCQSAMVRLALLLFHRENDHLPTKLDELPPAMITPWDWTNAVGVQVEYRCDAMGEKARLYPFRSGHGTFDTPIPLSAPISIP